MRTRTTTPHRGLPAPSLTLRGWGMVVFAALVCQAEPGTATEATSPTGVATAATPPTPVPATAEVITDGVAWRPGQPMTVGVLLRMETDWHVYWRNPGDSGLPTLGLPSGTGEDGHSISLYRHNPQVCAIRVAPGRGQLDGPV